jgi:ferric-dicitrate binding protein FerR (iron transport regulator)
MDQIELTPTFRLPGQAPAANIDQLPPHLADLVQRVLTQSQAQAQAPASSEAWTRANFAIGGLIIGAAGGAMAGALFWSTPGPTQIVQQPGPVQIVERPVIVERNCLIACGN